MDYLSLPLVLREGYLSRTNLEESIIYSIGLLLSTRVGQMPFAPGYGSNLWENEYSDLLSINLADVRAGLRNAIHKYEKRLHDVSVSFVDPKKSAVQIKGIYVKVSGVYVEKNQKKKLEHNYRIS